MKRISHISIITILILFSSCNKTPKTVFISPGNDSIEYMGRVYIPESEEKAELYWSGSSITLNFEGTGLSAWIDDERGENYYNIIIDNDSLYMFKPDSNRKKYCLVQNLPYRKHSVQLFKRTEYDRGVTTFYGFELEKNARILPPKIRKLSIEFYGNSITAGYAVEDTSDMDRPDSIFTNNYHSYAALTARHFDADYTCICKSGIGIMISWFPYTMPDIYDRLNPLDENSKWDFSYKTPDLVVVNLFQNDSWLIHKPERQEFKTNFGTVPPDGEYIIASYKSFIKTLRNVYPKTPVICALGSMDITQEGSPWPGYVEKAVSEMNDSLIYTNFFNWKGTPGHPRVHEQKAMASDLTQFIEKNFGW